MQYCNKCIRLYEQDNSMSYNVEMNKETVIKLVHICTGNIHSNAARLAHWKQFIRNKLKGYRVPESQTVLDVSQTYR